MYAIELLGVLAALFELLGLYLLSRKIIYGFLINLLCNISWILYVCLSKNAYGLLIVCIFALYLNTKGYLYWKENR